MKGNKKNIFILIGLVLLLVGVILLLNFKTITFYKDETLAKNFHNKETVKVNLLFNKLISINLEEQFKIDDELDQRDVYMNGFEKLFGMVYEDSELKIKRNDNTIFINTKITKKGFKLNSVEVFLDEETGNIRFDAKSYEDKGAKIKISKKYKTSDIKEYMSKNNYKIK